MGPWLDRPKQQEFWQPAVHPWINTPTISWSSNTSNALYTSASEVIKPTGKE